MDSGIDNAEENCVVTCTNIDEPSSIFKITAGSYNDLHLEWFIATVGASVTFSGDLLAIPLSNEKG